MVDELIDELLDEFMVVSMVDGLLTVDECGG